MDASHHARHPERPPRASPAAARSSTLALIVLGAILPWGGLASEGVEDAARGGDPPESPSEGAALEGGGSFETLVRPFLESYCTGCHGGRRKRAGLALDEYREADGVTRDRKVWEKVLHMLDERAMPPEDKFQPTEDERLAVTDWIRAELESFDCGGSVDPGKVTLRRLNRVEYDNTLRDLLGIDLSLAADFPADETGYGFDNIGDVLSLPPLLMEKYLEAAGKALAAVVGETADFHRRFEAEEARSDTATRAIGNWALSIDKEGEVVAGFRAPRDGLYLLRAEACGDQAGPEPPRMAFRIDGEDVAVVRVEAAGEKPDRYETLVRIPAGKHRLAVAYLNNYYEPDHPDPKLRGDRNLIVDSFSVQLLVGSRERPESYRRLFVALPSAEKTPAEASREVLERFATRAYRRPLRPGELERIVSLAEQSMDAGDSFETAVATAATAILASPHFLFRVELDDGEGQASGVRPVGRYELASRLSYFLWGSMPDEELFRLAGEGRLHDIDVLESQALRLLEDPRSRTLVESFAGQWLQTRFLEMVSPDPDLFPGFDEELRDAMSTETLLFFESIVREDRSVLDLIDGDYTFLNGRLARHYGIEGVEGPEFRRVSLEDTPRGGVLTQASYLTVTSNPTRTSPVKRGLWVLERILGTPPPPPPPDVPDLEESEEAISSGSLRQRLERHREDPMCASCHARMDPIGFAFENFDAVGRWRDFDGEFLIDASGTLPDGSSFEGPAGLRKVILEKKELFTRALAEKMLTYALGRGLEHYDKCAVDDVAGNMEANGYRFSSLILGVVRTEAFRMRRGDGGEPRE